MNDTNWSKHRTSTLESAFTLEAAVSAAQIYLRYTNESVAKRRVALPKHVHPAQAQSLIAALDVVLQGSAMLGDDMSLAAFFRAHNVDPVLVDIARPILEKATLLMPCMATLPNIMTLTHPVYIIQGDVTVLPPLNRAPRTGGATAGGGASQKLVAPVLIVASSEHPVTISIDAVASAGSKGASAPRIVVLPESHTIAAECTVSRHSCSCLRLLRRRVLLAPASPSPSPPLAPSRSHRTHARSHALTLHASLALACPVLLRFSCVLLRSLLPVACEQRRVPSEEETTHPDISYSPRAERQQRAVPTVGNAGACAYRRHHV